jgi:hypothetical protein
MVRFFICGFAGAASGASAQEANQRKDEENDETNLRDPGSGAGDAGKAEDGGDQRDDEKDYGVVEHGLMELGWLVRTENIGSDSRDNFADAVLGFTELLLQAANEDIFMALVVQKVVVRELGILFLEVPLGLGSRIPCL